MNVKGIIFDKDGTLMEYEAFWVKIAKEAVADTLVRIDADIALAEKILSASGYDGTNVAIDGVMCCGTYSDFAAMMWAVLADNGVSVDKEALQKQIEKSYYESFSKGDVIPACDNLRNVLENIKSKGIKIALVTNDSVCGTEHCLKRLGISHVFHRVYADDGVTPPKPDPYRIHQFCREENISPENIVVVGDTVADMLFAQNAGATPIGVAKNDYNKRILEQFADVIDDISKLNIYIK